MEAGSVGTAARDERNQSRSIAIPFLTTVLALYALAGLVVYALITGPIDQLLNWIGL